VQGGKLRRHDRAVPAQRVHGLFHHVLPVGVSIMKTSDLQSFIRSGGFAWPGGYQCALMMADGECLDARSARENYRLIRRQTGRDWTALCVFIHWEGEPLTCAHSGREIPSAYGECEA